MQLSRYIVKMKPLLGIDKAEDIIMEDENKFRSIIDQSMDGIIICDENGLVTEMNKAFERIFQLTRTDVISNYLWDIVHKHIVRYGKREISVEFIKKIVLYSLKKEKSLFFNKVIEYRLVLPDNKQKIININLGLIKSNKSNMLCMIVSDITALRLCEESKKTIEQQLYQSQKMETVSKLMGGIAHDFNNMLTAILGNVDIAMMSIPSTQNPLFNELIEIRKNAQRAANLTRQLITFSSHQSMGPVILDINSIISDMEKMMRRLIRENIDLTIVQAPDLWPVKIDPGQFEQVIINLVINARDAIREFGKIVIETKNVVLSNEYVMEHREIIPGDYVMIAVSDTGSGIDKEILSKVFEPFFTTKEFGKGTGLGLSACIGIVKQVGGEMFVYSVPGQGTSFKVYLPRSDKKVNGNIDKSIEKIPFGTEKILLVEDEQVVRKLTSKMLKECGYTVVEAENGEEALKMIEEYPLGIDLLISDIVMPKMGGKELMEKIQTIIPQIKALFVSGYPDAFVLSDILGTGMFFLAKPYSTIDIAVKVREVLDS